MRIRFEMWLSELGISINVKQFFMQKYITNPKITSLKNTNFTASPVLEVLDAPYCTLWEKRELKAVNSGIKDKNTQSPFVLFTEKERTGRDDWWRSMASQAHLRICLSSRFRRETKCLWSNVFSSPGRNAHHRWLMSRKLRTIRNWPTYEL